MQVIPSIDLSAGRSRLVFWPGAAIGAGAPTDRAERISRHFVEAGARSIHLVDLDGAKAGRPVNTEVVAQVARAVATPLQLAGGVDGPEQIELAFAAGATRVVIPLWIAAEGGEVLAACVRAGGAWLAAGLDARAERLSEYPWRRSRAPNLEELVAELAALGVERFVLSHGGASPDLSQLAALCGTVDAEFLVAGGVSDLDAVRGLRDVGVHGLIVGEALFNGSIDFGAALSIAA